MKRCSTCGQTVGRTLVWPGGTGRFVGMREEKRGANVTRVVHVKASNGDDYYLGPHIRDVLYEVVWTPESMPALTTNITEILA